MITCLTVIFMMFLFMALAVFAVQVALFVGLGVLCYKTYQEYKACKASGTWTTKFKVECAALVVIALAIFGSGSSTEDTKQVENEPTVKQEQQIEEPKEEVEEPVEVAEETEAVEEEPEPIVEEEPEPVVESVPFEYENALRSAENYIDFMGFSKQGLRDQLDYEGYSKKAIKYAVDNVDADWKEECVESAESYLSFMSFSERELRDQLEYEGYTKKQINYAIDKVYK